MSPGTLDLLHGELDRLLAVDDRPRPVAPRRRQPVHTVYVAADRYAAELPAAWGTEAAAMLSEYPPGPELVAVDVAEAVRHKLATEPIEDLRIDFEDGYGVRPDAEEDAEAIRSAAELSRSLQDGTAPWRHGIRFKSFEASTRRRGLRTLDLFVGELVRHGTFGPGLVVTLPKVSSVDQVRAMVASCSFLEERHALASGSLRFEIQVELPRAVIGDDGRHPAGAMVEAAAGRLVGFHYGTYDYSAACGVAAPHQALDHPVADFAKLVLIAGVAGRGVEIADGSSNRVPAGTPAQLHEVWADHARLVRRSLEQGLYQGWDLHPGQLVTRYAATFSFFRAGLTTSCERLRAYLAGTGTAFTDEPATYAALTDYLVRGVGCGAVALAEVEDLGGTATAAAISALVTGDQR